MVTVSRVKNGKALDKDEIIGEMIKNGKKFVIDLVWKLNNKASENDAIPDDWRTTVMVHCMTQR